MQALKMQALKKALLDLRVAVLAEIVRGNMLTADEAAARERTARRQHEGGLIGQERRTKAARLWKRLTSRRFIRPRKPAIWPTPQHLVKSDSAPDDRR